MTLNIVLIVLLFGCIVGLVVTTASTDHPCKRNCTDRSTRVCHYNFTIENYFVLSRACYGCPFNYTDCFRSHCVSTNGLMRHILTVNRQMPGPSIEVCKGDTVQVMVKNKMDEAASTSIHWHGLKQMNTNMMDGVPQLTQCYIQPSETFRYEFKADNAGTHWWHSHAAVQFGDGLFGAFIVRDSDTQEPSRSLYDVDLPDHIMMINDWPDKPQMFRYMEEMQHRWVTPKVVKVLVNGRGRKHLVDDPTNALGYGSDASGYTPYEMFNVIKDKRYRFRVIAAATRCYFRVMVDSHVLTVISSDGVPMKPTVVDYFMIHPGERYDFVLNTNKAPGNYWIKVQSYGECADGGNDGNGGAILHYHGYSGVGDIQPSGDIEDYTYDGVLLNPETSQLDTGNMSQISQSSLRYDPPGGVDIDYTDEMVDVKYYISLKYQTNDNNYYSHPEYYPNSARRGIRTPTLNNVVELFIASHTGDPHQMHLHGHTFRVVGDGYFSDVDNYQSVAMEKIKQRDENGEFPRTLINPWVKDTVTVQSKGGYIILRFKADNPGIWFFHCHNEGHLLKGMAMIIKIGSPEEFPKLPPYHQMCGITHGHVEMNSTSSAVAFMLDGLVFLFVFIGKYLANVFTDGLFVV